MEACGRRHAGEIEDLPEDRDPADQERPAAQGRQGRDRRRVPDSDALLGLLLAACGAVASTPLPTDRPHRYGTMRVVDTLVRPSKGIGSQCVRFLVRGDTGDDVQESFPLVYELQDTQACRAGNAYVPTFKALDPLHPDAIQPAINSIEHRGRDRHRRWPGHGVGRSLHGRNRPRLRGMD